VRVAILHRSHQPAVATTQRHVCTSLLVGLVSCDSAVSLSSFIFWNRRVPVVRISNSFLCLFFSFRSFSPLQYTWSGIAHTPAMVAISGPTAEQQPVFSWERFPTVSHVGQPTVWDFDWVAFAAQQWE